MNVIRKATMCWNGTEYEKEICGLQRIKLLR